MIDSIPFDESSITVMLGESHKSNWHVPWEDWKNRLENPLYLGVLTEFDIRDGSQEVSNTILSSSISTSFSHTP
ncbi:MAG: hypothetical protein NPMRTH1_1440010 [Nitrosopumilales archaeon]|nr:MAG: hypothetical protein NPMRTH1_1440010 [Nitrosopumilales archaeon]